MLKNKADIAARVILLFSVALTGTTPALAGISPASSLRVTSGNDLDTATEQGLQALMVAFREKPARQTVDHPSRPDPTPNKDVSNKRGGEAETRLTRFSTRKFVEDLRSIRQECSNYDQVYRIDCLRQGIEMMAASMPDNSEYREAKRILRQTSTRLGRIVSAYKDPGTPRLEVPASANPRFRKARKYTAIRREAVPEAMAKAQAVVEEAATALLRSGENSDRRYAHYQEIATAVGSTKTLLRSS